MAQHFALMWRGKISEQTFQEMGPSETAKEKAKVRTIRTEIIPPIVRCVSVFEEGGGRVLTK